MRPPASPEGWLFRSSAFAWMMTGLPTMSFLLPPTEMYVNRKISREMLDLKAKAKKGEKVTFGRALDNLLES